MSRPALDRLPDASRWVCEKSHLFGDPSPFRAALADGAPGLTVVTGDNASGKSLWVRVAAAAIQKSGVLPVSISIRERTGGGTHEMGSLRRSMMFGQEDEQSTGATSVKVVQAAFKNLDRPDGSVLILDEPEIGLAESYARALGEYIGQQARQTPPVCRGVIVVTHSRPLVHGLQAGYGTAPTHVAIAADSDPVADLDNWLNADEHRSVEDLLTLDRVGFERWRQVSALLKS